MEVANLVVADQVVVVEKWIDRQKMVIALMSVDTGARLTTFCVASLPHAVTLLLLHIVLFVGRANNITGKVEKTNNQGPQLTLRRALL
jgi:hypothetical protein